MSAHGPAPTPAPRVRVWLLDPPGDRPNYQLQWLDPATGGRKTRSSRTSDPQKAEDARADLEFRLNAGMPVDAPKQAGPLPWAEFRERYLAEHGPTMRERSREKVGTVLDAVEGILAPKHLADITDEAVQRLLKGFRARKVRGGKVGLAPHTQRSYLRALGGALNWAAEAGLLAAVPRIPKVKVPKKRPIPIPAEEIERLLAACPSPEWRVFLQLALWAGLRLSEAHHVRWGRSEEFPWLDVEGKRVWIPHAFAKAWEDQWVPLHPLLLEGLLSLPRENGDRIFVFRSTGNHAGRELTRSALSNAVIYLARRAGLKLSMHRLRKAFGCKLAGRCPAAVLQRLMRHASISTTMDFYCTAEDATLREAIDGLE